MARYIPNDELITKLKDKVVVLTGGATGVGAALVDILHAKGAKVVFGDIQVEVSESHVQKLASPNIKFVKTNAASYEDLLNLFDTALNTFGRVDCAIANAGVPETGNWVDPDLDLEGIKTVPNTRSLDVNLLGPLYFARIAAVYLRQNISDSDDKSLILISSVAGFKETPGMPVYQAAKHGVLGLTRCLRLTFPSSAIRINCICPWFIDTYLASGIRETWLQHNLPRNEPAGVAKIIVGVAAEKGMHGKALFVEGNRGWEVEDNLNRLEPLWLGEENSRELNRGNALMGGGEFWQK